mmetsp:Transcript_17113/g.64835  ORF Transcript_17113/g.64835 Transcript_17113/m.64835 type:complete len:272 (-) Transcript_17113:631-1446(-)
MSSRESTTASWPNAGASSSQRSKPTGSGQSVDEVPRWDSSKPPCPPPMDRAAAAGEQPCVTAGTPSLAPSLSALRVTAAPTIVVLCGPFTMAAPHRWPASTSPLTVLCESAPLASRPHAPPSTVRPAVAPPSPDSPETPMRPSPATTDTSSRPEPAPPRSLTPTAPGFPAAMTTRSDDTTWFRVRLPSSPPAPAKDTFSTARGAAGSPKPGLRGESTIAARAPGLLGSTCPRREAGAAPPGTGALSAPAASTVVPGRILPNWRSSRVEDTE